MWERHGNVVVDIDVRVHAPLVVSWRKHQGEARAKRYQGRWAERRKVGRREREVFRLLREEKKPDKEEGPKGGYDLVFLFYLKTGLRLFENQI
jgi:hypothetical protein